MKRKSLSYTEELELEDQLPEEPEDAFQMYVDPMPNKEHLYWDKPSMADTTVFRLMKENYTGWQAAKLRALRLMNQQGLKAYKSFETARAYVWYCTRK